MNYEDMEEGITQCTSCGYAGDALEFIEDADDFEEEGLMVCPNCGIEFKYYLEVE